MFSLVGGWYDWTAQEKRKTYSDFSQQKVLLQKEFLGVHCLHVARLKKGLLRHLYISLIWHDI